MPCVWLRYLQFSCTLEYKYMDVYVLKKNDGLSISNNSVSYMT